MKGKLLGFLVCIVAGFAVAGITEILQLPYFTQGRYCSFEDVMLDFFGYCVAAIPIILVLLSIHFIQSKRAKRTILAGEIAIASVEPTEKIMDNVVEESEENTQSDNE